MCAVYQNTPQVTYHSGNIAYFTLQFNDDGTTFSDGKVESPEDEGGVSTG